ncbi:MAG: SDR family NAD(P)-dependent oxidoreductase [Candidatus Omnitrophica bacterium]|nr:SDR family NAD(P)-dependent oxidoreductase [Candidatus Omnitrophota bacterium]
MILKGKRVLVTGAEGFIGSHLVEKLLEEGCKVRAFVLYNSFNSLGWLDSFPKEKMKKIDIALGDVRDSDNVRVAARGTDIIFHLAALIGIPFSYHSPESYVDTNIKGTLNVLQAAKDIGVKNVLVTSTSETYGTARYAPMDEKHPRQGQSPYSATKIAADAIAESFYRSFGLPVTIVRPFNTYGPRQSARAVIPTIITQLLSGRRDIELGNVYPTRDLVFVKDVANGFVAIARSEKTIGKEINIATGSEISIKDLARKLISMINPGARIISDGKRFRPKKSEVERLVGSNARIRKLAGWRPGYSLEEGLKETIEWFRSKDNMKFYRSDVYNI